ncbi:MAG: Flp pilus assembly complex ATPase component TadA [Planctomycetes bacterium]|nr:Flp pilus assembly complex ATPase component TadA [Planctomycetota bacterium]
MMKAGGIEPKALLKKLYEMEEVDQPTAQAIYKEHRKSGIEIIEACVKGGIREDAVLYALANLLGMEMVQLTGIDLPQPLIEKIPQHVATSYRIIPVRLEDDVLVIATSDPDNLAALDDLKFMLGVKLLRPALTSEASIDEALKKYYPEKAVPAEDLRGELMKNYEAEETIDAASGMEVFNIDDLRGIDMGDAAVAAESAPVRKLLNLILLTAVKAQASDVHFEPFEATFQVRNRIDGVLYEMLPVPKNLAAPLVARIKVMAHLDIAERRMPQDGKISVRIGDREVDLRVSSLPTMFGESVVIRILDRSVVSLDLDKVGFPDELLTQFKEIIQMPNGIVVVTGPTGSGKTTTLYAALSAVNEDSIKIITTEDPVEYEINGLIQVPIDDEIGKSFGACLRSILRQDPDVLLVGEVRDAETAQIAIQASLTGHLVFTTLHTNDAPTAVTRLIDMGIEPFLLAATLETILAQRLVRTICMKCKTPYTPSEEEVMSLALRGRDISNQRFFYGKGCEFCKNTGYKGRTAIFELLTVDDAVRELVLSKASANQIRSVAQRSGMKTLRDAGIQKIFAGLTTIEEVVKETMAVEE